MVMVLEGIRVIDFTNYGIGPGASAMLADLGAEVIHIEELGVGDPIRGLRTMFGVSLELPGGRNSQFEVCNRNKKDLALNLKAPEGKEIIYELTRKSDVFVTNYRQRVLDSLTVDYDTLVQHNPKLIYVAVSGFGRKGPAKDRASYDLVGQAMTGMMFTGDYTGEPQMINSGISDGMTSIMAAHGTIAALLARERHGIGQQVFVSQLGATLFNSFFPIAASLFTDLGYSQVRSKTRNPLFNWYRCKDDRWIGIVIPQSDRYWPDFCAALGLQELATQPEYGDLEARARNCEELIRILDRVFASRTYAEWENVLSTTDLAFCPILKLNELVKDRQILANDYIADFDHPALGRVKMPGQPVEYSETPASLRTPAPEYAEHTEQILLEVCGYDWEKILSLKEKDVV